MSTCDTSELGPRIAGAVQQLNVVHNLYVSGDPRKAHETLAALQAKLDNISSSLWREFQISGVGHD